jgi:hypothetical protein
MQGGLPAAKCHAMAVYFSSNFKYLKPMTGEVPYWPFEQGPNLARRARHILGSSRTDDDVDLMAQDIEDNFQFYFDQERQAAKQNGTYDEDDYPRPDNSSSFDVLVEIFDFQGGMALPKDVPEAPQCEYFAALALSLIAGCVRDFRFTYDLKTHSYIPREFKDIRCNEIVRISSDLIEATEAVCRAEVLKMSEVDEAQRAASQNRVKEERHAELQAKRHKKTNDSKALVWAEFEKDTKIFDSATDHATAILKVLHQTGKFEYKHSTVTNWVRERARQLKIRFR